MSEFRFSSRSAMFNYYLKLEANDCPISFSDVIYKSGFDFYHSAIEIAEQCLIDVWLRANELAKNDHPTPLKKAAMDTWRTVILRKRYSKNRYWVIREDRDISVDQFVAVDQEECDSWLAEAVCQELEKRGLVEQLFAIVGLPVKEASHRNFTPELDKPE